MRRATWPPRWGPRPPRGSAQGVSRVTLRNLNAKGWDTGLRIQDDDFDARSEQGRDNVALQEVDDCHAVVGGDEDTFGH